MNVIVTTTMCEVDNNTSMNSGEYNINKLHFTFSSAYLNEYVKKALFTIADGTAVEMVIENDECQIPNEVLRNPGTYLLGVYAYSIENNELILRYSPKPTSIYVNKGSYIENVVSPTTPTPNEFEQYYQAMQLLLTKAANKITLEINDSTYKLKAKLFDRNDNLLSESNEIDLPMENAVNNGSYDNDNKKIILTEISGETIDIPIDGILIETVDKIALEINNDTYKLKAKLFDRENQLISESNEIDLPMENAVNNGTYDNENKKIVLTQINGETIDIPISALIDGLAYQNDVDTALNTKVDKVEGKQLSTNDFTNALKTKLDGIEDSADVNIIESISKNGTAVTITNKNVDITVPTKTSDITNDSGFITKDVNNLTNYTKTVDMNTAISNAVGTETTNRENADVLLQGQIDAITSSSDVVDIVGTYVELQNYDTSSLTNDDVIKVLQDSTHNNALSYYRWTIASRVGSWVYIGSEGPFYTKGETDTLLNTKQATIDSNNKLSSDLVDDTNKSNKFVTTTEKTAWDAKYNKPANGIPKSDLVESVQESLNKADTAIQDVSDKEDKSNKVTEINSSSTDTQYPSAKCVYDSQEEQNEKIAELEMLYNAFPTVSDEDTEITLDGTAEVNFKKFDLKGNTSQYTTTGKNLLDSSTISIGTNNGITCSYDSLTQEITFNGTCTLDNTTFAFINTLISAVASNTTASIYYVSGTLTNYGSIRFLNENYGGNMNINLTTLNNDQKIASIASDLTQNLVNNFFRFNNGSVANNFKIKVMVADSTGTTYEPYTGNQPSPNPDYPQDIQVVSGDNTIKVEGKNLLKYPYLNTTSTVSGVTFTDNGDGSITIDGTSTSSTYSLWFLYENAWDYNKLSFELNPGTYTFKGLTTNKVKMVCNFYFSDNSNEYFFIAQNDVTKTITNKVKLNMRILVNGGTTVDNVTIYPQIEVGSSSSSFEPYNGNTYPIYLGNIELCKIGDYQDYFYKDNGKWYLNKQIGKVVLDGSESWVYQRAQTRFYTSVLDAITENARHMVYSNYYRYRESGNTDGIIFTNGTTLYLYNYSYTSVDELKNWLSTHNTIVYYVLATPTTTEITDTTLIEQLDNLEKAYSYDKQTNVSQINADKPFIINAEAILSLKSVLDIEDELTALDIGNGVD